MAEVKVNKSKAQRIIIIYHPNPEATEVASAIAKIREIAATL